MLFFGIFRVVAVRHAEIYMSEPLTGSVCFFTDRFCYVLRVYDSGSKSVCTGESGSVVSEVVSGGTIRWFGFDFGLKRKFYNFKSQQKYNIYAN